MTKHTHTATHERKIKNNLQINNVEMIVVSLIQAVITAYIWLLNRSHIYYCERTLTQCEFNDVNLSNIFVNCPGGKRETKIKDLNEWKQCDKFNEFEWKILKKIRIG